MLGYMIAQVLGSRAGIPPVVTLLTRVEVDAADPAFRQPGKYIGPVWAAEEQSALEARYGWQMKKDGDYVRRVVPSPRPQKILERQAISQLLADGNVVICAGGGGMAGRRKTAVIRAWRRWWIKIWRRRFWLSRCRLKRC
jgi:carbamate kinase